MPCPYAERKGPVIICKVTKKKMNPLTSPCLTNKYIKCKYYKQAQEKIKEKEIPAPPTPAQALPRPAEAVAKEKKVKRKVKGEVKGITLDGRKPANCLECIYYGSKTSTCILLGIEVKDPYDPPCART